MKGVINKGIQELIEQRFGKDTWQVVCDRSHCDEPSFSALAEYPDQLTVDLIVAAAETLDMSADDVMIEFGKFWVGNTGRTTYPTIYNLAGSTARDFLRRMDRVHEQVTVSIENASPPHLRPEDLPDGRLLIHYSSQRKLCPVLHGLILGVGLYFDAPLSVHESTCMRNGSSECLFEITFQ